MTFADTYRHLVIPKLHNLIKAEAACIVADVDTFTAACSVVMKHALLLGAAHLPEDVFMDLEDWVSDTLCREVDAAYARA